MTTKILKSISIGLILMFQLACNGKNMDNNLKVNSLDYRSEENTVAKYELKIPQIENEKSEDITYFNATMKEEMRYILENLSTDENDGKIQDAYVNFEEYKNNFGVLSITVLSNVYTGGAHSTNNFESYNINLKDNSILTFDKLFTEEAKDYFNMKINDMIKNKDKVLNTNGNEVMFFDNCEANIANAVVYFEGDNVVFVFHEYDLSPYSSGMPVFKFDKKDVKKYLNI